MCYHVFKDYGNSNYKRMAVECSSSNDSIIDLFTSFQKKLDLKHDKHERIVKLSRDCTIHSKRTIFLLHRKHASKSNDKQFDDVIIEAESRLKEGTIILKRIAEELKDEIDPLKYHSAYTCGIQEFIEALSFYIFQKESRFLSFDEAKKWLSFTEATHDPVFPLTSTDYVLGLADLTGELMRLCINAAGSGDLELPFFVVKVLRDIYCCYLSLGGFGIKEMSRKVQTLKNSLYKIENVCYNIKVRGSEVPNKMLVDMLNMTPNNNND